MNNLDMLRKEISEIGIRLYNKGFSPGASGNISAKEENNILITPSGKCLGEVAASEVVMLDFDGNCLEKDKKPSSEKLMHVEIYKKRPDIKAIIHAHSTKASVFAVAGISLDKPILSEAVLSLGTVPVAEYAAPSSDKLANNVAKHFLEHDIVLMANHGVVVGSKNLKEAYYKLEILESYAEILLSTMLLGKANELSDFDIKELTELRSRIIESTKQ